jgi:hypothetical protein
MASRILTVCLGVILTSTQAICQVISCAVVNGTWAWKFTNAQYLLSQDNMGNISGYAIEPGCQGNNQWPITGTIAGAFVTFTESNNGCTNGNVTHINYSATVGAPGCNFLYGSYTNSQGGSGAWGDSNPYPNAGDYVTKAVDVPTSETTVIPTAAQWDTAHGAPWNQTLVPNSPSGEFEGRGAYEYPPIGPGNDSCWFQGSAVPIFDAVTTPGFGWLVTSKNTWGTDFIGWNLAAVQYYRGKKRAPCSSTWQQQMVIDAAFSPNNPSNYGPYTDQYGNLFYGVPYETNTIRADITATTVTSVRNGKVSANKVWK